jgi:2-(1,2-epoxy-1,2-dihydrophenyl)acetyl-CoA isomerase
MGVTLEIEDAVATVTLRWPEQRNALGPDEANEVAAVLRGLDGEDLAAVVLTGEGAFCAGGNVRGMVARKDMPPEERRKIVYGAFQGLMRAIVALPVPTVAALDGPAVGMGFDIALGCDSRLVGPSGWARQGWGGIGLIPGTGGVLLLRLRAPQSLWRILPGQPKLDGPALEGLGLAEAVAEGTALAAAQARGRQLADLPRATVKAYVELDRALLRAQLEEHLTQTLATQVRLLADPGFAARAQRTLQKS